MDFDETRLYYTHQQLQRNPQGQNGDENAEAANNDDTGEASADNVNLDAVRRHFKEFLSEWFDGFVIIFTLFRGGIGCSSKR